MSDVERAKALFEQGLNLFAAGDFSGAESRFRTANELAPGRVSILGNLSATLLRLGLTAEASAWARKALSLDPKNFEAHMNLGACLEKEGATAEALRHFEDACTLRPDSAEAWSNHGNLLNALKRHDEALADHRKAVSLQPAFAEGWTNLGNALNDLGCYEEALESHDRALALRPNLAEAWYNRGNVLVNFGRNSEALANYDHALAANPQYAEAHHNKGLTLLDNCDFPEGWKEYEWRWKSKTFPSTRLLADIPEWNGQTNDQAPRGRLLVCAEQGVGDEILYCSMLEALKAKVERLTVIADARLIPLFRRAQPGIQFLPKDQPVPVEPDDRQVAMGSLGQYLRTSLADFPAGGHAYLKPDAEQVHRFRNRIAAPGKRICGIAWTSNNPRIGAFKSLRLKDLLPVLSLPDLAFVDLQYGDTSAERRALREESGIEIRHLDDLDSFNDLDGLSALINACDEIVTVSNVTAHLAGAQGKTTALLMPHTWGKLWYWHGNHDHSPWYPAITLYRQTTSGWETAIGKLASNLSLTSP